jgi:hypothetical protein
MNSNLMEIIFFLCERRENGGENDIKIHSTILRKISSGKKRRDMRRKKKKEAVPQILKSNCWHACMHELCNSISSLTRKLAERCKSGIKSSHLLLSLAASLC